MKHTSIADDSRKVKKGGLFVAIKGEHFDGYDFIPDAIKKGAMTIVSQRDPKKKWLKKVEYRKVKDPREALSDLASEFYGNPSEKLKIIGVTGTDGKTTTSHMIYEILKKAGKKVDLISTISSPGLHVTSPEPLVLQKLLAEMVKKGMEYVVLETTSHAIAQKRVASVRFDIAVLTNITHEHLDYHKTFEAYRDTKLKLFQGANTAILNKDDETYTYFDKKLKNEKITYSIKQKADYFANSIVIESDSMSFVVHDEKTEWGVETKLIGTYNAQNALAAFAVARKLGVNWGSILDGLREMKRPTGRLEKILNKKDIDIYIDFAHTPNALKSVLTLLDKQKRRNLIVVFGCAGERDYKKRPMMARIATDIADSVIFTAEDPRYEDVGLIFEDMLKGIVKKTAAFVKIPERGKAIYYALNKSAKKGDTLVICGKAHEKSMAYNGIEYPWSDFKAVKLALSGKTLEIRR